MTRGSHVDRPLAILIGLLVVGGAAIFTSAAFGLLARGESHTSSVVFNHLVLGVGLGTVFLFIASMIDYRIWREWSLHLFIAALAVTALVFVPTIGFEHGGGRRWIELFGFTFQPSEALKIGGILFVATLFSTLKEHTASWTGLLYFLGALLAPAALLIAQPDMGTFGVVVAAMAAVYIAAGARWRDIGIVFLIGLTMLATLAYLRPYVLDRVTTFMNPGDNPQGEGYQIRQSLIAIGSGELTGRGFGQGVQKFTYLPEPMGDSIFAVAAEEFGFIGGVLLILLFLALALRTFFIAALVPDMFGALVAIGIATYFVSEAFINIASMLALAPLTGIPLTFISQGGSAMLISLASAGILLNISRRAVKK